VELQYFHRRCLLVTIGLDRTAVQICFEASSCTSNINRGRTDGRRAGHAMVVDHGVILLMRLNQLPLAMEL
jgi:hypothetical protein